MSAKKRNSIDYDPKNIDSIIAHARRERDAMLRNMIGSLFGR